MTKLKMVASNVDFGLRLEYLYFEAGVERDREDMASNLDYTSTMA